MQSLKLPKVYISVVKPNMLDMIWHKVKPMLEAAIEYSNGELDIECIKDMVAAEDAILVVVQEDLAVMASALLEVNTFQSGKKVLSITLAGGSDMHIWMDKLDEVIGNIAKKNQCSEIYIMGRIGWVRMLKDRNFKIVHSVLSRRV